MKANRNIRRFRGYGIIVLLFLLGSGNLASAQGGPSVSVSTDFLPYQEFDETVEVTRGTDTIPYPDARVQIKRYNASISYPLVFAQGRTVVVNSLSYTYREFAYRDFIDYPLKALHAADFTLMLQQNLSPKWSVWTLGTLSLASDLEAEISKKDFGWQAAAIFIHHVSQRFSIGAGIAYSAQFGQAEPIPLLALDWNNGSNMMARAILPASLEFWYRIKTRWGVGLIVSGDGNNFHGDPEAYLVDNPRMRFTLLTVAPAVKINISPKFHIKVEGGVIGLHRFEFYDDDIEHASYDLKPSYYVRTGLHFGG